MNVKTSQQFSINWRDAGMAFLTTAIAAFVATSGQLLEDWLTSPNLFDIDRVNLILSLKAAFAAGAADLFRRFISGSKIIFTNATAEQVKAVKSGEATVVIK